MAAPLTHVRVELEVLAGGRTSPCGLTYVGHHRVLRRAGDGRAGLQRLGPIATPLQRLHLAIGSTSFCLLLPSSMGKDSGYA